MRQTPATKTRFSAGVPFFLRLLSNSTDWKCKRECELSQVYTGLGKIGMVVTEDMKTRTRGRFRPRCWYVLWWPASASSLLLWVWCLIKNQKPSVHRSVGRRAFRVASAASGGRVLITTAAISGDVDRYDSCLPAGVGAMRMLTGDSKLLELSPTTFFLTKHQVLELFPHRILDQNVINISYKTISHSPQNR